MAYAPGVQNRAGDYLMRGMESFGQSIGGAIIDVAKTNKENTKKAKVMDSAWDLMQGQGLVPAGASPQDFSVKDKALMFDGVMTATDLMGKAVARKANEAQIRRSNFMKTSRGVVDLESGSVMPGTEPVEKFSDYMFNTGGGLYNARTGSVVPGTSKAETDNIDPRFRQFQGPTVRFDQQTYGVWNPEKQVYEVQVAKAPGERGFDPKTGYYERGGGTDISGFPQWRDPAALMGAPGAVRQAAPAAAKPMDAKAQAALDWAKANPNDPRSAAILKKLGM